MSSRRKRCACRTDVCSQLIRSQALKIPWTLSHGFYALMGGFVFDFDQSFSPEAPPFATGIERLSLTPQGVKLLALCGCLPEVTKRELADKSKVDELGKLLACVQAGWMLVQVCARLAMRLPVTLLEVTTVGHVMCALLLYALWWHKPRNVGEPTVLTGEWTSRMAAFMVVSSQVGQEQMLPGYRVEKDQSEISGLKFFVEPNAEAVGSRNDAAIPSYLVRSKTGMPKVHVVQPDNEMFDEDEIQQNELTQNRWQLACRAIQDWPAVRRLLHHPRTEPNTKFELALAAYPEMPSRCRRMHDTEKSSESRSPWLECNTRNLVTAVASNWPHDGLLRTTNGLAIGATLWVASIAFSGVHIAAWHASYPSRAEAWLWRSASLYIGFSGALWAVLHVLAEVWPRLWWIWYDIMCGDAPRGRVTVVLIICGICGCSYLFSRAFLIVEAFASLRSLPAAAYLVPQWTLSVPHFG